MTSPFPPLTGTISILRYELSKIVGSGSYGKVAEAYSVRPPRTRVAIKQCQAVFGVLKVRRWLGQVGSLMGI
jgi:hypothetical protein